MCYGEKEQIDTLSVCDRVADVPNAVSIIRSTIVLQAQIHPDIAQTKGEVQDTPL